uniref:Copia protein n=1 Tax=Lactuca sativa TaxID=4236 RepID=A0A9R1XHZ9_LACSA|nr:hypothetical protein LSAT_V11C500275050 [Lactuca sativa]
MITRRSVTITKQSTISRSSIESEYKALGSITCEIIWILKIMFELEIKNLTLVSIFYDNDTTIKLALNPVFHERTKYFETDFHFVREKISNGLLKMVKINPSDQNVDTLTKSLSIKQHNLLTTKIGLIDVFKKEKYFKWGEGVKIINIFNFQSHIYYFSFMGILC